MRSVLAMLVLVALAFSCHRDEDNNKPCIDTSKISQGACTYELHEVCGCDGKTYPNPCAAGRSGVINWTEGPCPK